MPSQFFVGFDGADVVPSALIDDDGPNLPGSLYDSSDERGHNRLGSAGLEKLKERGLNGIDAGEETALNSRIAEDISKIADLARIANVHV